MPIYLPLMITAMIAGIILISYRRLSLKIRQTIGAVLLLMSLDLWIGRPWSIIIGIPSLFLLILMNKKKRRK